VYGVVIMKKTYRFLLSALLLLGVSFSTSALAHDSFGFSLNVGQPYYYEPPTVYYSTPLAVYYEPRPIYREYYREAPAVYYAPRVSRYYDDGRRRRYEHHRHHNDD